MQKNVSRSCSPAHWTHGMALERGLGLPHGMLLSDPQHGHTMIERVLATVRLEDAMLDQLASILTVSLRDWLRK